MRFLAVFASLVLVGQQPRQALDYSKDPCGSPFVESQFYTSYKGSLLKVVSGDTLLIRFPGHGVKVVHLACLRAPNPGEPSFEASRQALIALVGGKVEVEADLPNFSLPNRKSFTAMVEMADWSKAQLEAGMARFVPATHYEMGHYDQCRCRLSEQRAKSKKIGIWTDLKR